MTSPYASTTFENPLSLRVDGNFLSTMSISPNGRDAVLAGRRGLFVIDLDDPFAAPRWLHHETQWEVADVQWSPHKSKPSWIVSTSNQKAMVWNIARPSHDAIEHVLHGHTRAITDINFHPTHPELLATCSVDSFVLAWDLRTPKAPTHQWADWRAGSAQVKWNYQNSNIVASAHDSHIMIWDVRKGALPLKRINAHDARINGIDWSRETEDGLISCSNDMTVKFWSCNTSCEVPYYTIHTDFPVARARHVPFGDQVCGIMPLRGGDNSVYIVKYGGKSGVSSLEPSHVFKGHTEPIKDFLWRSRHPKESHVDDREFQLVTWSQDCDLRLWPIPTSLYKDFNYTKGTPLSPGKVLVDYDYRSYRPEPSTPYEDSIIIRHRGNGRWGYFGGANGHRSNSKSSHNRKLISGLKNNFGWNSGSGSSHFLGTSENPNIQQNAQFNHLNWISGIRIGQSAFLPTTSESEVGAQPQNLGEEVSDVGHKFPKLRFERISVSTGNLVISLNGPWRSTTRDLDDLIFLRVEIDFPQDYPSEGATPKFRIEETHDLDEECRQELLQHLKEISETYCNSGKFCLEPCMRYLLGEKVNLDVSEGEEELLKFEDEKEKSVSADQTGKIGSEHQSISEDGPSSDIPISDESSEEEEDEFATSGILTKPSFDSTPVPKNCGAIWTPSGHLICFFNLREEKKAHLIKFGQQGFSLVTEDKNAENEGNTDDSHTRMPTTGTYHDQKTSSVFSGSSSEDDSSDSSDSSSSSSLANDLDILQYDRLYRMKIPDRLRSRKHGSSHISTGSYTKHTANDTTTSSSAKNVIEIYDFSRLMPAKMDLAFGYRVVGDTPENLCLHNAEVAELAGYQEIATCWRLLSILLTEGGSNLTTESSDSKFFWGIHPFGGLWLIRKIVSYYEKIGDIQMLAMISCILNEEENESRLLPSGDTEGSNSHSDSATNVITTTETVQIIPEASSFPSSLAVDGSGSSTSNFDQAVPSGTSTSTVQIEVKMRNQPSLEATHDIRCFKLKDVVYEDKLMLYRSEYASLLFMWGLPASRTKILKFNYGGRVEKQSKVKIGSSTNEYHEHMGQVGWIEDNEISYMPSKWHTLDVNQERRMRLIEKKKCQYCLMTVSRMITICSHCGHVMHAECAMQWWEKEHMTECPSGCGCNCLEHGFCTD